jgi:hypothetical protein
MTRQDEFKAELFDLLRRYKVEMSIDDDFINFWSYTQHDGEGNEIGSMINLNFRWENGKE